MIYFTRKLFIGILEAHQGDQYHSAIIDSKGTSFRELGLMNI